MAFKPKLGVALLQYYSGETWRSKAHFWCCSVCDYPYFLLHLSFLYSSQRFFNSPVLVTSCSSRFLLPLLLLALFSCLNDLIKKIPSLFVLKYFQLFKWILMTIFWNTEIRLWLISHIIFIARLDYIFVVSVDCSFVICSCFVFASSNYDIYYLLHYWMNKSQISKIYSAHHVYITVIFQKYLACRSQISAD